MPSPPDTADQIAELARLRGRTVAVAESLTAGAVATRLGAAPDAATWFRGGVVAYHDEVKHEVLGVAEGPVVCDPAARQMARGVARVLSAEVAVATTGAGGPDPQDGREPGTVFVACISDGTTTCRELHLPGDPGDVVAAATEAALELLLETLRAGEPPEAPTSRRE